MKLTFEQYRLLVRLYSSYQQVRPTNLPARKLVDLGLAQWSKKHLGKSELPALVITPAGRERI